MKRWLGLFGVLLGVAVAVVFLSRVPVFLSRVQVAPSNHVRKAAPYQVAEHKVKQLAAAMHCYEQKHGHFPASARFGMDGRPLLSWRVLLLPYLDEQELYKDFRLDEPWDGPTNRALLERMPRIFASPRKGSTPPYTTPYQVFVGKGAAFEGIHGLTVKDFTDGIDRTILVVEASNPVPWTKPEDVTLYPDNSLPGLGNASEYSFVAALADGTTRRLSHKISAPTLRALITRNAGDDPGKDW
ncbi:hypothetical protein AYO40_06700 [Planctomycetaceae bacterium SCGC AG-212-D15]|nr:hypothetical protein AYO40_06700 [Planctomycetaceae bacterium SCGC AG-212-D15]